MSFFITIVKAILLIGLIVSAVFLFILAILYIYRGALVLFMYVWEQTATAHQDFKKFVVDKWNSRKSSPPEVK